MLPTSTPLIIIKVILMTSETIYKRYTVSCLQCRSEISKSNFSKHIDSIQCASGGKYAPIIKDNLICDYCNKLCKSINSVKQHEIRCKENPNRISLEYIKGVIRSADIAIEECSFCKKEFKKRGAKGNHEARCPENVNRKLQIVSAEGKLAGKKKYSEWVTVHYSDQSNRDKVSERMQQAVNDHPESYTSGNRGRTKQIIYNNIKFQGQWELDFYMWCETNSVFVIRSPNWFNYTWGRNRKYNPDFYIPSLDLYVEVKGYETDQDRAKWNQFPCNLSVIRQNEIMLIRKGQFSVPLLLCKNWSLVSGNAPSPTDYESAVPL